MSMTSHLLQRGIKLWKKGEKEAARAIFRALISNERANESAWMWYIYSLDTDTEKIAALEKFLSIAPQNEKARLALETLRAEEKEKTAPLDAVHIEKREETPEEPIDLHDPDPDHPVKKKRPKPPHIFPWVLLLIGFAALVGVSLSSRAKVHALESELLKESQAREQVAQDFGRLSGEYQLLHGEYQDALQDFNQLAVKYNELNSRYSSLTEEYAWLDKIAVKPPYIVVKNREVKMAFTSVGNRLTYWSVPFDWLENDLRRGNIERDRIRSDGSYLRLYMRNTLVGEEFNAIDYRKFVDPRPFQPLSKYIYERAPDEYALIYEMWNIVRQLTAYSSEITDTPRYPMETLLAGGGDCEDHAILLASMILAAPVAWDVELVYMDIDNPASPVEMNHLIVKIDTGNRIYRVEATGTEVMEPYPNVVGWYYPISEFEG